MAKKLFVSAMNGAWQLIPAVANMVVAAIVVRLFSAETWGAVVELLVWQQLANGILNWGNKEFLQRHFALTPATYSQAFASFFVQRLVLLLPIAVLAFMYFNQTMAMVLIAMVLGRYIVQSFYVNVTLQHRFGAMLAIEILGVIVQVSALFFTQNLIQILFVIIIGIWLKVILNLFIFRLDLRQVTFSENYLKGAFFFAMLGISGMLLSKLDLVGASQLLSNQALGHYQIIMMFLLNLQAGAMFVSGPFIHHFYRSNIKTQNSSSKALILVGLPLVLVGLIAVQFILKLVYNIRLNISVFIPQLLFCIMPYVYLKWILKLNQDRKEWIILMVNVAGIIALFAFFMLLSFFGKGSVNQILWIMAAHQCLMALGYLVAHKINKTKGK
ncbi:MAG: hypothetical protein NWR83_07700 [Salibacteraceae bacterium]|nr:hypothetical protein [Salibacteraceae bacterium]